MNHFHLLHDLQLLLLEMENEEDIEDVKTFIDINNQLLTHSNIVAELIASITYAKPKLYDKILKLISYLPNLKFELEWKYFSEKYFDKYKPYYAIISQLLNLKLDIRKVGLPDYTFKFKENEDSENNHPTNIIDLNDPYIHLIYKDDARSLQQLICQNNYDIKQKKSIFISKNDKLYNNSNLLQFSALFGSIECFKYLFNLYDSIDYEELLRYSIAGGNYDIIHITENKIDDIEVLSNPVYLNLAIIFMNNDIIEYIINNYNVQINSDNYNQCIFSSNCDSLLKLIDIDKCEHINEFGGNGSTPLNVSIKIGNIVFFEFLLDMEEVDVIKTNKRGYSILFTAVKNNRLDIVKFIIENGLGNPNLDISPRCCPTVFIYAKYHYQFEIFEYFKTKFVYIPCESYDAIFEYVNHIDSISHIDEYDVYYDKITDEKNKRKRKIEKKKLHKQLKKKHHIKNRKRKFVMDEI